MNAIHNIDAQEVLDITKFHSECLEDISNKLSILSHRLKTEAQCTNTVDSTLDKIALQGQELTSEFLIDLAKLWTVYQSKLFNIAEFEIFDTVLSTKIH